MTDHATHALAARIRFVALSVAVAVTLAWPQQAAATEPRVVLLRGWFGLFSTGLDEIEDKLKAKGIKAEVRMHTSWDDEAAGILKDRAGGRIQPIVLIGHSQGANNVISIATLLKAKNVPVDLLVTLAPFLQPPIPNNVIHAINYYQSPGWGTALSGETGSRGKIDNVNLIGDLTVTHITVDKTAKIQDQIIREIEALAQKPAPLAGSAQKPATPSQTGSRQTAAKSPAKPPVINR